MVCAGTGTAQHTSLTVLLDTQCQTSLGNNMYFIIILLVIVEEVFRERTVSGKKVFANTRTVCSPTPVMLARGKRKGLVPTGRKRGKERRGVREGWKESEQVSESEREREREREREKSRNHKVHKLRFQSTFIP